MPNEKNKTLKFCHCYRLIKLPFVVLVNFEMILEKSTTYDNNTKASPPQ